MGRSARFPVARYRPRACRSGKRRYAWRLWLVFFDRGLIDALAARAHLEGRPLNAGASGTQRHYHHRVFVTPPWPEIYVQDDARRHDFASATQEYERLLAAWPSFGYKITLVPKTDVAARADFVLRTLQDDLDARGEGIDAL
ncbi:AAA family ATPase [Paraburkholderia sp. A2WS-5]|uniref:AAA family ATPase n=1 Tax=unclassified Paraburkholderia TaxID=2615204 RepID=UPI003B810C0C